MMPAKHEAPREVIADAVGLIDQPFSWMRFPPVLEQQFLNDGAARRLRYVVITGVLSLLVFNGFLVVDYLMARDVFWMSVKLRLFVFTPVATAFLLLGWLGHGWVLRHIPPSLLECTVLTSGVCAAMCLAFILSASHSPLSQYYHVGLMVVMMYGTIVQRLRFWYAVVYAFTVYAIHVGGILMVPAFNQRLILPMLSLMGAALVFTLMSNHALERDERRHYLLSLRRKHLRQDLGDVYQRLQKLARMDALTGVHNRRHGQDYLHHAWRRAQHDGSELAIIMLDVDHFKLYNDHHGHPAGDRCLASVAQAMAASLRQPIDLIARFGGEEFIVVLPRTDAVLAQAVAERIRRAVQDLALPHTGSITAPMVTVSLGVAVTRPADGLAETELISQADAALYRAKQAGRNQVAS